MAAGVLALLVARPAFPSEDAEQGTGLVVVALWAGLALLWGLGRWFEGAVAVRLCLVDVLALLLVAAVLASAWAAEYRRPAINLAAEWAGLGLAYFLVRVLYDEARRQRALLVGLMATAFALACYGVYQSFWGLERLRAEYAANPAAVLAAVGIAPGSPMQATFENRLRSHEPFATFALANSLAGFLVAWLPVSLVWFVTAAAGVRGRTCGGGRLFGYKVPGWLAQAARALSGAAVVTVLVCLILTQSRTAYAGLLVAGLGLSWQLGWPLVSARAAGRGVRRWLVGWVLAAAVVIGVVVAAGVWRAKIDTRLLTGASRSLRFRWQYWVGTWSVIREHPWLGTGPGNFRGYYLEHKLAESSEEIADPHNMFLEAWATSGLAAALALALWCAAGIVRSLRASEVAAAERAGQPGLDWPVLVGGGVAGAVVAWLVSAQTLALHLWLFGAWLVAAVSLGVAGWGNRMRPEAVGWSLVGLALHLMGSGGLSMPGVAEGLWVLIALAVTLTAGRQRGLVVRSRAAVHGLVGGLLALFVGFGFFVVRPVGECRSWLSRGRWQVQRGDWSAGQRSFAAAAAADPLSPEPLIESARMHYRRWLMGGSEAERRELEPALVQLKRAGRLAPRRLDVRLLLAELWRQAARRRPSFWPRAVAAARECVRLYPTSAALRAMLADVLWQAGRREQARQQMRQALRLHELTPHPDKKLTAQELELIQTRLRQLDSR